MPSKNKNMRKNMNVPLVSICTPTFNRRPFFQYIIKCFENQTYPKERMEWIIIDDGTDKIEDIILSKNDKRIKYFKYDEKMTLGKKRNLCHEKCLGDIIVYMDDDDYYPPERVSHAVETLQKNPYVLCAGSSEMYFYFKHIQKMYTFGPYSPNHATAATFAFRKELLLHTSFDETASVAEEKKFLKGYTIPFVQLDSKKSILVFSHIHNSYDKKTMLENPSDYIHESKVKVEDIVKEADMRKFFMEDIDNVLQLYEPGKLENKPDVIEHIEKIKREREEVMKKNAEDIEKVEAYKKMINNNNTSKENNNQNNKYERKINDMMMLIQELTKENRILKDRVKQLENK
jgi:glycosyltransferase involved in cell wall biosynthesis